MRKDRAERVEPVETILEGTTKMANGEYEIDEQTFKTMPLENQNWIMYRTFNAHRIYCNERICSVERRTDKLEKRRHFNTAAGAGGGIIGGAIAYLTGKITGI